MDGYLIVLIIGALIAFVAGSALIWLMPADKLRRNMAMGWAGSGAYYKLDKRNAPDGETGASVGDHEAEGERPPPR